MPRAFTGLQRYHIMNEIQYLAKSLLQDYKISYVNIIRYYKIFFHPSYNTKKFILPYFKFIPFFQQILI